MREFLLRRRDWNTPRERDRLRVLSVYIYIEGTCQRERDFFFYLVLNFTLIRFFFNPKFFIYLFFILFLILILMCVFLILQFAHISTLILLSSMAPGIHYYFNFFPCFSLSLPQFHLFPPFFLSYHISFYFIF